MASFYVWTTNFETMRMFLGEAFLVGLLILWTASMGICKSRAIPLEWGIAELRAPLKEFTDIKALAEFFSFSKMEKGRNSHQGRHSAFQNTTSFLADEVGSLIWASLSLFWRLTTCWFDCLVETTKDLFFFFFFFFFRSCTVSRNLYQGTFQDLVPEEDLILVPSFCEILEGNKKSEIQWGKLKTDFTSFLFPF